MSSTDAVRQRKLSRLLAGGAPRTLELCSGCGGMSLGLLMAGFQLTAHVESDPTAAASYALNFAPPSEKSRAAWSKPRDMLSCSAPELVAEIGFKGSPCDAFDVLAAGLPCQAFARIGRSKLRSISGDEDAFRKDPRATLYRRFLEYVAAVQPVAILMENVPDILNFGGHNVPGEISATLAALGYRTKYTLLNASYYGVPQMRERLFLIAVDASLNLGPAFPIPTHKASLPRGYEGTRSVALKHVPMDCSYFYPIPEPSEHAVKAVSARSALADLPFISQHFTDPSAMRKRQVQSRLPYRTHKHLSDFAQAMRSWTGFSTNGELDGHVVRLTARDFPIFRRMPHGADYPKAIKVAEELFREKLKSFASPPRRGSARFGELQSETIPPYDPGKFPNKWWKLDPLAPSRTLTAHIGKDTYTHIHYDGRQQRTISVREAARLQSFPDGFRFAGAMNAAFRQIGNAVPPLLALAVARTVLQCLIEGITADPEAVHRRAA